MTDSEKLKALQHDLQEHAVHIRALRVALEECDFHLDEFGCGACAVPQRCTPLDVPLAVERCVRKLREQLAEARSRAFRAYDANTALMSEVDTLRAQVATVTAEAATDGPAYQRGRSEGRADVAASLRALLDPSDAQHWNLDGALTEVRRIVRALATLTAERDIERLKVKTIESARDYFRREAVAEAIRDEREACAKVAEAHALGPLHASGGCCGDAVAAAIRARGGQ